MTENISDFDNYIDACKYILDQMHVIYGDDIRELLLPYYLHRVDTGREVIELRRTAGEAITKFLHGNKDV